MCPYSPPFLTLRKVYAFKNNNSSYTQMGLKSVFKTLSYPCFILTQPIISFYQMQTHSVSLKSRLQPLFNTMLRYNPELEADRRKTSVPHPMLGPSKAESRVTARHKVRFLQGQTIYWTSGGHEGQRLLCPPAPKFLLCRLSHCVRLSRMCTVVK